jgi:hypothetical protein
VEQLRASRGNPTRLSVQSTHKYHGVRANDAPFIAHDGAVGKVQTHRKLVTYEAVQPQILSQCIIFA